MTEIIPQANQQSTSGGIIILNMATRNKWRFAKLYTRSNKRIEMGRADKREAVRGLKEECSLSYRQIGKLLGITYEYAHQLHKNLTK